MAYQGFGGLKSVNDLFDKLKKDYLRLLDNEADSHCAFDFFVTANHMIDWLYPNDRKLQRDFEESEILLQLCSHIANGAKHFTATAKKHKSVSSVGTITILNFGYVTGNRVEMGYKSEALRVELDGEAKAKYGENIEAKVLAAEILEFWRQRLYPNTE